LAASISIISQASMPPADDPMTTRVGRTRIERRAQRGEPRTFACRETETFQRVRQECARGLPGVGDAGDGIACRQPDVAALAAARSPRLAASSLS
jgi:hypothetical protein